jgi:hypothetical protein
VFEDAPRTRARPTPSRAVAAGFAQGAAAHRR